MCVCMCVHAMTLCKIKQIKSSWIPKKSSCPENDGNENVMKRNGT